MKDGLNRQTPSKIQYNNLINKKIDDVLISTNILTNTNKDIIILDFHISRMNKEIKKKKIEPMFLKGSIGFLVLFITLAFQCLLVFYQKYGKIDFILLATSVLIFMLSISINSFLYIASAFYRDVNDQIMFRLKQIISHLEVIKLRRLHENEEKSESRGKNKFKRVLDILFS